jgi:asparagine synthetase B (glutamine-hydrolysing)
MPGIIGAVAGKEQSLVDRINQFKPTLTKTIHPAAIDQPLVKFHAITNEGGIGRASCKGDGTVSVLLYGHCFNASSGSKLDARAILRFYRDQGLSFLDILEGAFHIIIYDLEKRQLMIINDRLGILPLYWTQNGKTISFSHKLKHLCVSNNRIDEKGILTFLISGYCYLDRTLFEGVHYLTPASIFTVELESMRTTHRRYWNLVYHQKPNANSRELCRRLDDAITKSVELFTPDGTHQKSGIFLSGGWDSKGILGTMIRQNRRPHCVISNGENDLEPYSDTYIARRLAHETGIPFRLNHKDPQVGQHIIREGVANSELITDTSPEVFGQHNIAPSIFEGLDFMFKGDEVWGWQDYAFNRQQAIGHVMPNVISPLLGQILSPSLSDAASELYFQEIERIWSDCNNENWNDRKDYLYLYGRVNRYIFGLGNSDEQHIEVRRPYLTARVMAAIADTPPKLRVQKNLFKQMMISSHPRLVAFGDSYTSSIPDYYYHMQSQIIDEASRALKNGLDFGGAILPEKALLFVNAFSPSLTRRTAPPLKLRLKNKLKNRWMHTVERTPYYFKKAAKHWEHIPTSDDRIVFRLWLLCRLFDNELA